jgi:hypothetical protein
VDTTKSCILQGCRQSKFEDETDGADGVDEADGVNEADEADEADPRA